MERPQVHSSGSGVAEVYYARLAHDLVIKVTWQGNDDFVESFPEDLPLAKNIPSPVAEKINVAFRVARKLESAANGKSAS